MPAATPASMPLSRREPRRRSTRRHPNPMDRIGRVLFALALAAATTWMVLNAATVRTWEARLVAFWMNGIVDRGATSWNDTYILWIADDHLVAFEVTAECTAVILLTPLFALGAILMLSKRVSWIRGIAGIASGAAIIMLVNQVRLALIGWSTQQWGLGAGYEYSHKFTGSVIGIVGFAAGLVVMLLVVGVRRKPRDRHQSPSS